MKRYLPLIALLITFIAGVAVANTVHYFVSWEQNSSEACTVTVYGQLGEVYLDYDATWRPQLTIHFPADVARVIALHLNMAADDSEITVQMAVE